MTDPLLCPDVDELQRFLTGRLPGWQAEELGRHLESCAECLRRVEPLNADDAFVAGLRGSPGTVPDAESEVIDGLMGRLKQLRPRSAGPGPENTPLPAGQDTPPHGSGEPLAGTFNLLEPARQAGELGRLGGYRVLRQLGQGGMGVVFLAEDLRLGRLVALKVLLDARYAEAHYALRFEREAEALARLQHPNIVQIHQVGKHHGRPYLVLEYVAGGSLAQRLAGQPQPTRDSAALMATLARAVQHAHAKGIIHRDLKPGNILLQGGETAEHADARPGLQSPLASAVSAVVSHSPKITDFGLAKRLDDEGLTQTGDVLGTPGYVAPEQTGGQEKSGPSGASADVYSLGAILYELLTGRPPFRGASVLETLEQARECEPLSPRRLRPGVPRDLETICLKCLQREPGRRYGTAEALADDLERWLKGEPILARPVSKPERLWLWVRRNPRVAIPTIVAGLSLVVILVGLLVGIVWIAREQQQTEAALTEAEANFQKACEVVNRTLDRMRLNQLADVPGMSAFHEALAKDALTFFQKVAPEKTSLPVVRKGTARAWWQVGEVYRRRGQNDAAGEAFAKAITLEDSLVADFPDKPGYRHELAVAWLNWGVVEQQAGAVRQAEDAYRKARKLLEKLVEDFPDVLAAHHELANTLHNLARLQSEAGRRKEAAQTYRGALQLRQGLIAKAPRERFYRDGLARTLYNLGVVLQEMGQARGAGDLWRQAIGVHEQLQADFPAVPEHRQELAREYTSLGNLLKKTNPGEAGKLYQKALTLRQRLAADFPERPAYRCELGHAYHTLGLFLGTNRPLEAENAHRNALAVLRPLVTDCPGVPAYESQLGAALNHAALLQIDKDNDRKVFGGPPADLEQARALFEEAIRYQRAALAKKPNDQTYRTFLRNHTMMLAETQLRLGKHAAAAQAAAELPRIIPDDSEESYRAGAFVSRCVPLAQKDSNLTPATRPEVAARYGEQALEFLQQAVQRGFKNAGRLKQDRDFAPIRSREAFDRLVNEIQGKLK